MNRFAAFKNREAPPPDIAAAGAAVTAPSRVLLLDTDLYAVVGGGQTAYRRIIAAAPQTQFFYFAKREGRDAARPSNAHAIPLIERYVANEAHLPHRLRHLYHFYWRAWRFADSVKQHLGETEFDVVDGPDYLSDTLFIRSALGAHGIACGCVALALHGTISSAMRDLWAPATPDRRSLVEARFRERLQYRAADARYALSLSYGANWAAVSGSAPNALDPLIIAGPIAPTPAPEGATADVVFIGRRERRKGPDIFADLVWCLGEAGLGRAIAIGDESPTGPAPGSDPVLRRMSAHRGVALHVQPSMSPAELSALYAARTVVVLPSRYDQFNLVALEALCAGCPTFVSRGAGVSEWIEQNVPDLQDFIIDIDCSRSGASAIRSCLTDYDGTRARVVSAMRHVTQPDLTGALGGIYTASPFGDPTARRLLHELTLHFDHFNRPLPVEPAAGRTLRRLRRRVARYVRRSS